MPISLKAGMGGGGGLPKLAPDTGDIFRDKRITLAALTTEQLALSLVGRFVVSGLSITRGANSAAGTMVIRLVADGETVWDSSFEAGGTSSMPNHLNIYGMTNVSLGSGTMSVPEPLFIVEESLQLFITFPAGTVAPTLQYGARPIQ